MKRNYSSVLESELLEATWWIGHEWMTEKQQIHTSPNMFPKTLFPQDVSQTKVRAVWSLKCQRFSIKIHEIPYFNKLCKEVL